jgi:GNAT superfamily N-acetyltransferase
MKLTIDAVDLRQSAHCDALIKLLDAYAQDPMGGGEPLAAEVKARLCDDMAERPTVASFIAWLDQAPVGLVNCVEGFSTFKSQPLMNIHDLVVLPGHRGMGIGQALLQADLGSAHRQRAGFAQLRTIRLRTLHAGPCCWPSQLHAEMALSP